MTTVTALAFSSLMVGDTPLFEIPQITPAQSAGIKILAKAEWHNPGGSVKDRAALAIVSAAEAAGDLTRGKTLLDATSGNTGIAYAWICARLGYRVTLTVPGTLGRSRRAILESYGAELFFTDPLEGSDGAIREARLLCAAEPGRYFYADQYNNEANWRAHYETTAPEIVAQTAGRLTHFVAGLGTSGTFVGTGRRLKELVPGVRLVSVSPDSPLHGLEGLKHMESAIVPGIYDASLAQEALRVSTEEAQRLIRGLARRGLLVGPSGGANLAAAAVVAERLALAGEEGLIVTVLPDSGERYLGERFWTEGA